jgi:antitoxin CcdA
MRMARTHSSAKQKSRKRAANLSVDATLLEKARALGIGVSGLLEDSLRARIREEEHRRWLEENKAAIEAMNRDVRRHGVWSKKLRQF